MPEEGGGVAGGEELKSSRKGPPSELREFCEFREFCELRELCEVC